MKAVKFSTQVDEKTLENLKSYVKQTDQSISKVVTVALNDYLSKFKVRPAFKKAADAVIEENLELLSRLAK